MTESHYTEVNEAIPANAICMICEGVTGVGHRGPLIAVGERSDNSGRMNVVHESCAHLVPRQSSVENIWAFASRFKYYIAAYDNSGMDSMAQETYPTVDMPKEEPAMTNEVQQKSKDGAPLPPQPF